MATTETIGAVLLGGEETSLRAAIASHLERAGATVATAPVVRSRAEADAAVAAATDRHGPLRAFVSTPPDLSAASLDELPAELFADAIDAAFHSPFLTTQAVLPTMRSAGAGRLVFVTSAAGVMGRAYLAHVAAAARAVIAFMKSVAVEEAPHVTANAIAAGPLEGCPVHAARVRSLTEAEGLDAATADERVRERIPLGALTTPREVADAVGWALRPQGRAVTGQVLALSGGSELQVWP